MPPRDDTAAPAGAEHNTLYVAIEISGKSLGSWGQEPGQRADSGSTHLGQRTSKASGL